MTALTYTLVVLSLCMILAVFSYVERIYRELDHITVARFQEKLEVFETEIEPHLEEDRRGAALGFAILAQLSLIAVAVETARGVFLFVPARAEAVSQLVVYLIAEALVFAQLLPYAFLARTEGRWLRPIAPALRFALLLTWPLRAVLGLAFSVAHLTDEEKPDGAEDQQEGIEALVEAAQEEGILEQHEAQLIEQMVEFSDKRVLELMTPRPDVVSIPAGATIAELRRLLIQTKYSRVVAYGENLDDVLGIVDTRDLLQVPESEATRRTVKELVRPALFVPETKLGSELLKEMQRQNQQMAIAVDEHGLVAGVLTIEDLVEEIVGEMGKEESYSARDILREPDGSVILRGSMSVGKIQELFGVELAGAEEASATTVAGLLNSVAGHVLRRGEELDYNGLHFEVVEANQRKVLRLRVRRNLAEAPVS
jgi:putative hemolysin